MSFKSICVYGAGALGGAIAAKLAAAGNGVTISAVARGAQRPEHQVAEIAGHVRHAQHDGPDEQERHRREPREREGREDEQRGAQARRG